MLGVTAAALGVGLLLWLQSRKSAELDLEDAGAATGGTFHPIRIADALKTVPKLPGEAGTLAGCNVLLVTLDTTRSDRIACYGNRDIQTPTLDRLAAEGVLFSRTTAVAPTTLPTHASILTGLYPVHHGARVNGLFRLDEEQETLAERLRDEGYRTGAVVSAFVLDSRYGLDQGFEQYDDTLPGNAGERRGHYAESPADHTTDRAAQWMRGVADERFFLWVHYFDPHHEYQPPAPFAQQYEENRYDGEIAYVDDELKRLLAVLDELAVTDDTLVVVVGDHGESLGQHGELTHGYLPYGATLRVPLILRCGERLGGGTHCRNLASQVDIVPTVLSLLGVDDSAPRDGLPLHDLPAVNRPTFFESVAGTFEHGWEPLIGVCRGEFKYIHSSEPELFDLVRDPGEQTNLYSGDSELVTEFQTLLAGVFGDDLDAGTGLPPAATISEEELAQLQALGYFEAGVAGASGGEARGLPREMIHAMNRVELAEDESKSAEQIIAELQALTREYPDFHAAWSYLGATYARIEEYEPAAAALERCLELQPGRPWTVHQLAQVRASQGRMEEAVTLLEALLVDYPDLVRARLLCGTVLGNLERFDQAAAHLKVVFELSPDHERGVNAMVAAYDQAGRRDEVRAILERHLAAEPASFRAVLALARMWERQGEIARAEEVLRRGIVAAPREASLATILALLIARHAQGDAARLRAGTAVLERYCEEIGTPEASTLFPLASLYAEEGRLEDAIATAERARVAARETGDDKLLTAVERLLARLRGTAPR